MKNLFINLIRFCYNVSIKPIVKKVNTEISSQIPKVELSKKHIKNAKLLTNRKELLEMLPKNGIVAELGVDEGKFSESILNINNPRKLHLIDYWGTKRYNQRKRKKVEERFISQIRNNRVEIIIGLSNNVVTRFPDEYFDWIYIDTSHSYEDTIKELEGYRTKIKSNGFITGHDYVLGNWNGLVRYGVIEAVYEFCKKYDWEIIYLTTENNSNPSFAIKRILNGNN